MDEVYFSLQDPTIEQFETGIQQIIAAGPTDSKTILTTLKALRKITARVSDVKPKYRILDTRSKGVQEKLLGFEGVIEFLQLLGNLLFICFFLFFFYFFLFWFCFLKYELRNFAKK